MSSGQDNQGSQVNIHYFRLSFKVNMENHCTLKDYTSGVVCVLFLYYIEKQNIFLVVPHLNPILCNNFSFCVL